MELACKHIVLAGDFLLRSSLDWKKQRQSCRRTVVYSCPIEGHLEIPPPRPEHYSTMTLRGITGTTVCREVPNSFQSDTHREILLNQPQIRMYLSFSN